MNGHLSVATRTIHLQLPKQKAQQKTHENPKDMA